MDIIATDESCTWSVLSRKYVLFFLNAENYLSTDAVVTGTVSTNWSNWDASGTFWIRSFWGKKLRNPGEFHSFLTVFWAVQSNENCHKSHEIKKKLAYFDRLCTFVSSKCCDISLNFLHSTKARKAASPKFSNMAFTWSLMLSRMVKKHLPSFISDWLYASCGCQAKRSAFVLKSVMKTVKLQSFSVCRLLFVVL